MGKLIIKGQQVYELDEECLKKQKKGESPSEQQKEREEKKQRR